MKVKDIKPCFICKKGIGHAGMPIFFKITMQRYGLNARTVQQTLGLESFFGGVQDGAVLANVMGADPDIADKLEEEVSGLICFSCSTEKREPLMVMEELANETN
jgi:hypothetical protein